MIRWLTRFCLISAVSFAVENSAMAQTFFAQDDLQHPAVEEIVRLLQKEEQTQDRQWDAIEAQLRQLPETHFAHKMLNELKATQSAQTYTSKRKQVLTTLKFRPIAEAAMPEGFPQITPVGVVEVKTYPAYRMAQARMKQGENSAFWTLFNHIKRNDIAMTAPVQMDQQTADQTQTTKSMAFLYAENDLNQAGTDAKDPNVEVVDVAPMTVISIGVRGSRSTEQIQQAEAALREWLSQHQEQYQITAERRVMGYNSPMIPPLLQYYEVQIPVAEKN